ncbi:MAG: S1C family serine protease [Polyangiaceae bacterium]
MRAAPGVLASIVVLLCASTRVAQGQPVAPPQLQPPAKSQPQPPPAHPQPPAQPKAPEPPNATDPPAHPQLPPPAPPLRPEAAVTAMSAPAAEAHGCDPLWFSRVYRSSRDAVVRIDSVGGTGAGFVFHSPRHVATAFHVVEIGRDVKVTLVDGRQIEAEVVVVDPDNDLAILELAEPATVGPLPPGDSVNVTLGTPVLVIGHPYATLSQFDRRLKGLLSWSVSQGILSGKSPELLQTDAAINPGNSGGPLLGCDGRVLGVISAKLQAEGLGFIIPVKRLQELTKEIGKQGRYLGRWIGAGPMAALAWQITPDRQYLGFSLGLGIVAFDRWATTARFAVLWDQDDEPLGVLDRSSTRMSGELDLHHRWVVTQSPIPIYVSVGGGGAIARDHVQTKRSTLALVDRTCTGTGCEQRLRSVREETSDFRAWPMAGVGLELPGFFASYAFQLDFDDPGDSVHRFLFGLTL